VIKAKLPKIHLRLEILKNHIGIDEAKLLGHSGQRYPPIQEVYTARMAKVKAW